MPISTRAVEVLAGEGFNLLKRPPVRSCRAACETVLFMYLGAARFDWFPIRRFMNFFGNCFSKRNNA